MRVSVIEDSGMVRRFYAAYLEDTEYHASFYDSSPRNIIELCKQPADVIICPAFPQYQDGPAIAALIKAESALSEAALIVSTSVEGGALSAEWDMDHIDGLLLMPFDRSGLLTELEQVRRRILAHSRKLPLAVVVDDSATARFVLQKEMEGLNFSVETAEDGLAGLELIREVVPDIVLTDIEMPNMNGLALCNALARDIGASQIPIVVISSIINDAQVRSGFGSGAIDFLKKPIDPVELAGVVAAFVGAEHLPRQGTALVVETDPTVAAVIRKQLTKSGVHSNLCGKVSELDSYLAVSRPDIIIMDLTLPDGNGADVCLNLRARNDLDASSIIVLAEEKDRDDMICCLRNKADDYLMKPFTKEEFQARIETHLKTKRLNDELTQRNRILEGLAYQDGLTGLMNRRYLDEGLPREVERAVNGGKPLGFLLMDLDHFKKVNDTYGHQIGDQVLQDVAGLIQHRTRDSGIACRYGGEEMCVMLPGLNLVKAREVAERIRKACEKQVFTDHHINQTISIGVSAFPEQAGDASSLVREADAAVYMAKHRGRNQVITAGPGV